MNSQVRQSLINCSLIILLHHPFRLYNIMLSTSHFKPLDYLHVSPIQKPSSSSSASSSPTKKFTGLAYNLVVTQLRGMCRAVSHVQYKLLGKLKGVEFTDYLKQPLVMWKVMNKKRRSRCCKSKYQVKICGSFRFHYNWGSSRVLPTEPAPSGLEPTTLIHYGSTRYSSSIVVPDESTGHLSDYLYWVEENNVFGDEDGKCYSDKRKNNNNWSSTAGGMTREGKKEDVNERAEKFISRCHEKFRLEREESNRMFQEMMARSL